MDSFTLESRTRPRANERKSCVPRFREICVLSTSTFSYSRSLLLCSVHGVAPHPLGGLVASTAGVAWFTFCGRRGGIDRGPEHLVCPVCPLVECSSGPSRSLVVLVTGALPAPCFVAGRLFGGGRGFVSNYTRSCLLVFLAERQVSLEVSSSEKGALANTIDNGALANNLRLSDEDGRVVPRLSFGSSRTGFGVAVQRGSSRSPPVVVCHC